MTSEKWRDMPTIYSVPEVHYRDAAWRIVEREDDKGFEIYHDWIRYHQQVHQWMTYYFGQEKSGAFEQQEADARLFMQELGFTNLPKVHLLNDDPDDDYKFWSKPTVIAQHDALFSVIYFRNQRLNDLHMHDNGLVAKTLVHEFVHATRPHDNYYLQLNSDDAPWYFTRSGFSIQSKREHEGSFYEEAFAEYITSCYTRSLAGDNRAIGIEGMPGLDLPEYLQPADPAMTAGPDGYAMELIAYGLEKRGLLSTEDFKQLLINTRHLETQAESLRIFAYLVEKLEPGLYTKLRKLEYGKENWQQALETVHSIVTAV